MTAWQTRSQRGLNILPGLDRCPRLLADYFGNYECLVYLAQTEDEALQDKAKRAAERLGLANEYRFTGYGELADFMTVAAAPASPGAA